MDWSRTKRPGRRHPGSMMRNPMTLVPSTDVSLAPHYPSLGGQCLETHRPPNMELLGGDADLRSKSELLAVGESSRGVHGHHRRVSLVDEPVGGPQVFRNNRLGVSAAI